MVTCSKNVVIEHPILGGSCPFANGIIGHGSLDHVNNMNFDLIYSSFRSDFPKI